MKLKDGLVLKEVAGHYIIVPTGNRVNEILSVVNISSSEAHLWDYITCLFCTAVLTSV